MGGGDARIFREEINTTTSMYYRGGSPDQHKSKGLLRGRTATGKVKYWLLSTEREISRETYRDAYQELLKTVPGTLDRREEAGKKMGGLNDKLRAG